GTGYHLRTLLDTPASFVSLPLRPQAGATATFAGTTLVTPAQSVTALVGNSVFDDPRVQTVQTSAATPTVIPNSAIRPNRVQVVTAFGGTFEPTAAPAFATFSIAMLGTNSLTPTPPVAPAIGGATTNVSLGLLT